METLCTKQKTKRTRNCTSVLGGGETVVTLLFPTVFCTEVQRPDPGPSEHSVNATVPDILEGYHAGVPHAHADSNLGTC